MQQLYFATQQRSQIRTQNSVEEILHLNNETLAAQSNHRMLAMYRQHGTVYHIMYISYDSVTDHELLSNFQT